MADNGITLRGVLVIYKLCQSGQEVHLQHFKCVFFIPHIFSFVPPHSFIFIKRFFSFPEKAIIPSVIHAEDNRFYLFYFIALHMFTAQACGLIPASFSWHLIGNVSPLLPPSVSNISSFYPS